MTIPEFLLLIVIAGIAGAIAQGIAGFSRGGCLVSISLGLIGALLGTWMARQLGLPEVLVIRIGDHPFPLVWSILGASLFVSLISLMTRTKRKTPPAP